MRELEIAQVDLAQADAEYKAAVPSSSKAEAAAHATELLREQADRRAQQTVAQAQQAEQVADAVKAAGLGEIDKRKVEIREQVRTVGTYQATVRLHEDVNANIEFEVVPA